MLVSLVFCLGENFALKLCSLKGPGVDMCQSQDKFIESIRNVSIDDLIFSVPDDKIEVPERK